MIVETRRGPEQFVQIIAALARLELTNGLDLPHLLTETTGRIPRDATIIAILPVVTSEAAIAFGNMRRQGYAVIAILNLWEESDFAEASGPLIAEGVETRHLKDETAVATILSQLYDAWYKKGSGTNGTPIL